VLAARTLALLERRRPEVLLVQNPSLILAALGVAVRGVLGYRLIVDAHNEAVVPFINRQRWVKWGAPAATSRSSLRGFPVTYSCRSAPRTAANTCAIGSSAACVAISTTLNRPASGPVDIVAGGLGTRSGRGNALPPQPSTSAASWRLVTIVRSDLRITQRLNVRFTGFLQEQDYWTLLRFADGIVDLTLMDDCLVCGAYEALALGKAMLLSNNAASVELFDTAAIFTDNTAADIRRALERLRLGRAQLEAEAERKRVEFAERWSASARDLVVAMGHRTDRFSRRADEVKAGTDLHRVRDMYSTFDDER
jgi:hypothetical protein